MLPWLILGMQLRLSWLAGSDNSALDVMLVCEHL